MIRQDESYTLLIGRVFGFPLPDPFRFPLLAWNPVELWRRWGIYNRHVLLQLVYFPLGGSRRRKYLNVMLTFLASALLLHSGWFGSKYWDVGAAGWRDQSIYFLLQGLGVCACLAVWEWTGKDTRRQLAPRVSVAMIAAIAGHPGMERALARNDPRSEGRARRPGAPCGAMPRNRLSQTSRRTLVAQEHIVAPAAGIQTAGTTYLISFTLRPELVHRSDIAIA
jgi:hypothetical protein